MSEAKAGDRVQVHYRGMLKDGTVFDSSLDGTPLDFEIGGGMLLQGFEDAVVGMEPGEQKTVTIGATDAYGQHDPDLVKQVDRSALPTDLDLSSGAMLEVQTTEGETLTLTVLEADEESVTLDANHPLAGQDLVFELSLVSLNP